MAASNGSEFFEVEVEVEGGREALSRPSNAESVEEDESELLWAAIERLPSQKRPNMALLTRTPSEHRGGGGLLQTETIDVRKLDRLDRELVVRKALATNDQDNHRLLSAMKERLDRVGLEVPKVEVRFENLNIGASVQSGSRALPTLVNYTRNMIEDVLTGLRIFRPQRHSLTILKNISGAVKPGRLHIVGEVQLQVHHCLLGLPGTRNEDIKWVLSHPQALAQCEMTLTELGVVRIDTEDTAGAAQIVASKGVREAEAVASSREAEIYGLDILAEKIQDDDDNITRFLILAREPIIPGTDRPFKTSIVFTLKEGPGVLFKALAVFALRDINLTKIGSRPHRKRPLWVVDDSNKGSAKYFDYLFYIDFEASMAEPRAQLALGHLQEFASFLRVLGCYPSDIIPRSDSLSN